MRTAIVLAIIPALLIGILAFTVAQPSVDSQGYETDNWRETRSPSGACYEVYVLGSIDFEMFEVACKVR